LINDKLNSIFSVVSGN